MKWPRAGGILAHPTSLPGPFGIGDLGPTAERFFDFLVAGGVRFWQTLPLGPTGYGNSPYAALSAFAGNPALISPERLVADHLLPHAALAEAPAFPTDHVDYGAVVPWKMELLRRASERHHARKHSALHEAYDRFRDETPRGSLSWRSSWRSKTRTGSAPGSSGRSPTPSAIRRR